MPEVTDTGFLSIGEVLGLLLEEFPDITISKIRFLESQGLISPERTASGYRKFYNDDVELLKVILTEQRRNYLPLRVIKDRLDSGQIDPTGEHGRPNDDAPDGDVEEGPGPSPTEDVEAAEPTAAVPRSSIRGPSRLAMARPTPEPEPRGPCLRARRRRPASRSPSRRRAESQLLPGVLLERSELCAMVGMTDDELDAARDVRHRQPEAGGTGAVQRRRGGDRQAGVRVPAGRRRRPPPPELANIRRT